PGGRMLPSAVPPKSRYSPVCAPYLDGYQLVSAYLLALSRIARDRSACSSVGRPDVNRVQSMGTTVVTGASASAAGPGRGGIAAMAAVAVTMATVIRVVECLSLSTAASFTKGSSRQAR